LKKGTTVVPEIVIITLILVMSALLFLMIPKFIDMFLESAVLSSAEVVARDIASLTSLSKGVLYFSEIKYVPPTEKATYNIEIKDRYVTVERLDEDYCKEGKNVGKEFCYSYYPVIFDERIEVGGRRFKIIEKDDLLTMEAIESES